MKCKALHIGREKLNTFGTVLRSNSGFSSSAVRPVHCCQWLYQDLHSRICAQNKTVLGCIWNKYIDSNTGCKTFTCSAPHLLCRVPVFPCKSAWFQRRAARPTRCRKKLSCEEWPALFTLQWSGHNQSVWEYLFFSVLPCKYKEIGLLRGRGLLHVWDHLYKCSGSVCTPGCVPGWMDF